MTLVRLLLAWILLAALPLQGYAAAAMLYCGPGRSHTAAAVEHHEHSSGHHHAAASAHGHGQHAQDDAHHPGAWHEDGAGEGEHSTTGGTLPSLDHPCSICAACSHSVALAGTPHAVSAQTVPRPSGTHGFDSFPTRPAPVPDKPPRA